MQRDGAATRRDHERPGSSGGEKKEIWSTLLNNVSSGKRLPEKTLIVLGGTHEGQGDGTQDMQRDGTREGQRQFIESLLQEPPSRVRPPDRSKQRRPPIANQFALGYTYQDVYDSEHEGKNAPGSTKTRKTDSIVDIVARLSLYTLNSPSPAYAPLLDRLITPETIPHTAIAILLDWAEPWTFVEKLRAWIRLINSVIHSLPDDAKYALEDNTRAWHRSRNSDMATSMADSHTPLPLGPGEYDEPLGLPLVVVCQNAIAIEGLEKERGYREPHFDYILQFLRTVLLKHGAGLIYTMPGQPDQLQPLIHGMMDIQSGVPGGRATSREKGEKGLKHNVVDRERVLVPPGWDSHGKIRVLREGFDVEGLSRAWSVDTQPPSYPSPDSVISSVEAKDSPHIDNDTASETSATVGDTSTLPEDENSTVALYSIQIQDSHPPPTSKPSIEVPYTSLQVFLTQQLERLEAYRADDERAKAARLASSRSDPSSRRIISNPANSGDTNGVGIMDQHIGPVQFNVGGIHYDADEALRRLKGPSVEGAMAGTATPERPVRTREGTPFSPEGHGAVKGEKRAMISPTTIWRSISLV
ncbi:hypothetical protein H2203_004535 [Taxawa tesnikishii (nom. ined.)]|nr:hypothetical protein H2203_004535 [Dothideales sp. JES 119]